jgi:hypothetical protein
LRGAGLTVFAAGAAFVVVLAAWVMRISCDVSAGWPGGRTAMQKRLKKQGSWKRVDINRLNSLY